MSREIIPLPACPPAELLDQVLAIEESSFPQPWGAQVFLDELGRPTGFVDLLCERQRHAVTVLGFSCCRLLYDELHILQMAVHPDHRRQGLGAEILSHVIGTAPGRGAASLVLEVRRGNRAARSLYEKHGFQQVGLRRGYYADNHEDAVVMTCPLTLC